MGKAKIDIEKLLSWAYRDELLKATVGGLTGWEKLIFLGTKVDEGSSWREGSFPVGAGEPHRDALAIDWRVRKTIPEFIKADWKVPGLIELLMGELAPWLDVTDPRIAALSENPLALVQMHAKMGTRPVWNCGDIRVTRVNSRNGKPLVHGVSKGRRYQEGAHSVLTLDPHATEIACARWEYWVWRQSLVALARESWNLEDYEPVEPAAADRPWARDTEKRGTLYRDPNPKPLSALPIKPQRAKVLAPLRGGTHPASEEARTRWLKTLTTPPGFVSEI